MIILDWGTSNLRGWWLDEQFDLRDARKAPLGIQRIPSGGFEQAFREFAGAWLREDPAQPVYAVGMIGSRNGWFEAAYAECPASPEAIARALRHETLDDGTRIRFVPGVRDTGAFPFPDVVRGEETQALGLLGSLPRAASATLVMPGTHSKWLRLAKGAITSFRTFVTGELFEVLGEHSFVGQMIAGHPATDDWRAFARGVGTAAADDARSPGLNSRIFSLRTGFLAGELEASSAAAYLSGLLIGSEFEEALRGGLCATGNRIELVAEAALAERYVRAGEVFGLEVHLAPADLSLRGALAIHQLGIST